MGARNKLLVELLGRALIARVVDAVRASAADPVIVVTGHQASAVRAALAGSRVRFAHNPDFAAGLSASLRCGIAALPRGIDGALIYLGDMPRVAVTDLDRLIHAFTIGDGAKICVPVFEGKRGNPVLWPARHFCALQQLTGDSGARSLLASAADELLAIDIDHDGVLADVDSPGDLSDW
jgi:molybdenum cofactor cytidylyltransferase